MDEKQMAGDYEVIASMVVGAAEIVMGERQMTDHSMEYMCAYCEHSDILEYFTNIMVGNDYSELLELYGQRIAEEAGKLREELRMADSRCQNNLPLGISDCTAISDQDDLEGKVIVVKADALKREFQRASFQLYLCTGGSGSRPNSRGTSVFCTSLYSGEPERFRRQDILGTVPKADLPEWAVQGLEQIREKQRNSGQQER